MADTLQLPFPALPDYHGVTPTGMRTAITGTGNRTTAAHEIGDTVVLVVEARVTEAGHLETKDGLVYRERLATKDLFEIPAERGKLLVNGLRQALADGTGTLPGVVDTEVAAGERVLTDASGVVATPAEVADLHGIPLDPRLAPVILRFSDTSTGRWPDDWAGLGIAERAPIGGFMRHPGATDPGDTAQVIEVLDDDTGETLERWTEADEDTRLLAAEAAALRAEAADRAPDRSEPTRVGELLPDAEAAIAAGNMGAHPDEDGFDEWAAVEDWRRIETILVTVLELDDGYPDTLADPPTEARRLLDADPAALGDRLVSRLAPYLSELAGLVEAAAGPGPFDPTPPSSGPDDELEPLDPPATPHGWTRTTFPDRPATAEPAGEAEALDLSADRPNPVDYAFVDRGIPEIRADLPAVPARARVLRLLRAEEEGRGRGLKPRKGVLDLLERRARELFIAAGTPPVDIGAGFDVPVDAVAVED
jgi:hypothetical protein